MKIGILTFHNSDNYGSVLQAYALRNYITKTFPNDECEIVNYVAPNQNDLYALYLKNNSIKNIIKNIRAFLFSKLLKKRIYEFDVFRKNYLGISKERIEESNTLRDYLQDFNIMICGSDQIWNPLSLDFSEEYFVPGFKGKKVAYAPSFGNGKEKDLNRIDKANIGSFLREFNAISVRENSGIKMIRSLGYSKDVELVLDPTLLLEKREWLKIIGERKEEKPYIFFYSINYNPETIDMVKRISKKTRLKVKIMFSTNKTYSALGKGFELIKETSPINFLESVRSATLVLSNSFHGIAFSTIFRKQFFALEVRRNGEIYKDERIHNLLEKFKIDSRIIKREDIERIDWNDLKPVNYDEKAINNELKKSQDYLINSIKNEY
ncbi:MAG: polysaccharide pyruvyl transferase family protein [Eubacterium sp.]|nr:polysaccharide pyruvyl transferase family protein [Eubacterium sp.]